MSKTSTLSFAATVNGDGATVSYIPSQSPIMNANAPEGGPVSVVLASGANPIPVPASANTVMIVPSVTSINSKQAKTVSGDTGVTFTSQIVVLPVAGLPDVYCTSAAIETVTLMWL